MRLPKSGSSARICAIPVMPGWRRRSRVGRGFLLPHSYAVGRRDENACLHIECFWGRTVYWFSPSLAFCWPPGGSSGPGLFIVTFEIKIDGFRMMELCREMFCVLVIRLGRRKFERWILSILACGITCLLYKITFLSSFNVRINIITWINELLLLPHSLQVHFVLSNIFLELITQGVSWRQSVKRISESSRDLFLKICTGEFFKIMDSINIFSTMTHLRFYKKLIPTTLF